MCAVRSYTKQHNSYSRPRSINGARCDTVVNQDSNHILTVFKLCSPTSRVCRVNIKMERLTSEFVQVAGRAEGLAYSLRGGLL